MIFRYDDYEYEPSDDVLDDELVRIIEEQICKNTNLDKIQKDKILMNIYEFLGNMSLLTYDNFVKDYEDVLKDNLYDTAMEDYKDSLYDEGDPYAGKHI